jgi:CheY-like chemotaxis protein
MANILIVDDDYDIAEASKELLESAGHRVRVGHSGHEGLASLEGTPVRRVTCDPMAPPTTEASIDEEERLLGRTLPGPLRARLLRENGGEIECDGEVWQLHPVFDPTDRRTIQRSANHIARETMEGRRWRGFPDGALVLATDGSGNRLVVLPGSDEIRRWGHESCACESVAALSW